MPPSSSPPQPSSGGNLKYLLLGLVFLGGATGLWFIANQSKAPPPAPAAPPPSVERVNPMAQPDLVLDEQKPQDAGQAAPEQTAVKRPSGHKPAEWECSGDLPTALNVINDNRAQVRSCYERRLKINNVLQGDMRLLLKVGAGGKVVATQVTGSLHDEAVFACVRNLASTWSFQAPSGGSCAVVQVPFQFSPKP